jgi:hypothetical protein
MRTRNLVIGGIGGAALGALVVMTAVVVLLAMFGVQQVPVLQGAMDRGLVNQVRSLAGVELTIEDVMTDEDWPCYGDVSCWRGYAMALEVAFAAELDRPIGYNPVISMSQQANPQVSVTGVASGPLAGSLPSVTQKSVCGAFDVDGDSNTEEGWVAKVNVDIPAGFNGWLTIQAYNATDVYGDSWGLFEVTGQNMGFEWWPTTPAGSSAVFLVALYDEGHNVVCTGDWATAILPTEEAPQPEDQPDDGDNWTGPLSDSEGVPGDDRSVCDSLYVSVPTITVASGSEFYVRTYHQYQLSGRLLVTVVNAGTDYDPWITTEVMEFQMVGGEVEWGDIVVHAPLIYEAPISMVVIAQPLTEDGIPICSVAKEVRVEPAPMQGDGGATECCQGLEIEGPDRVGPGEVFYVDITPPEGFGDGDRLLVEAFNVQAGDDRSYPYSFVLLDGEHVYEDGTIWWLTAPHDFGTEVYYITVRVSWVLVDGTTFCERTLIIREPPSEIPPVMKSVPARMQ